MISTKRFRSIGRIRPDWTVPVALKRIDSERGMLRCPACGRKAFYAYQEENSIPPCRCGLLFTPGGGRIWYVIQDGACDVMLADLNVARP